MHRAGIPAERLVAAVDVQDRDTVALLRVAAMREHRQLNSDASVEFQRHEIAGKLNWIGVGIASSSGRSPSAAIARCYDRLTPAPMTIR